MESTSLDDVLYRYASFRNLVDPITHDLIISLARYIHCPKPVGATLPSPPGLCWLGKLGVWSFSLGARGKSAQFWVGWSKRSRFCS